MGRCVQHGAGVTRDLASLIAADGGRVRLLQLVQDLRLPDCWIGAGFVRSAVWDHLHGKPPTLPAGDVDVVWFDPARATPDGDRRIEVRLAAAAPEIDWSVTNQARMHARNGDAPYASTGDALRHWPETATAVAVRLTDHGVDVLAPFGLDDLFALIVRPTPAFATDKLPVVQARMREKRWLERWPLLRPHAAGTSSTLS
jgi:uncharacterized protein